MIGLLRRLFGERPRLTLGLKPGAFVSDEVRAAAALRKRSESEWIEGKVDPRVKYFYAHMIRIVEWVRSELRDREHEAQQLRREADYWRELHENPEEIARMRFESGKHEAETTQLRTECENLRIANMRAVAQAAEGRQELQAARAAAGVANAEVTTVQSQMIVEITNRLDQVGVPTRGVPHGGWWTLPQRIEWLIGYANIERTSRVERHLDDIAED